MLHTSVPAEPAMRIGTFGALITCNLITPLVNS